MSLAFEYNGEFVADNGDANLRGLTIEMTAHDWTPLARRYTASLATGSAVREWRTAKFSLSQFHTAEGKPLPAGGPG